MKNINILLLLFVLNDLGNFLFCAQPKEKLVEILDRENTSNKSNNIINKNGNLAPFVNNNINNNNIILEAETPKKGKISTLFTAIYEYIRLSAHLFKVFFSLVRGIYKVSKLQYAPISIFGGTRLASDSIYIKQAHDLASRLALNEIPVLTGGGPGIMEAANCGASLHENNAVITMGITVTSLREREGVNKCVQESSLALDYFFARKWLLMNYSAGFVIFPGGFGTLEEFAEVLTLMQTKARKKVPIVLIGADYWKSLVDWIYNSALKNKLISPEDVNLFKVTDDIDEAYSFLEPSFKDKKPFSVFD